MKYALILALRTRLEGIFLKLYIEVKRSQILTNFPHIVQKAFLLAIDLTIYLKKLFITINRVVGEGGRFYTKRLI